MTNDEWRMMKDERWIMGDDEWWNVECEILLWCVIKWWKLHDNILEHEHMKMMRWDDLFHWTGWFLANSLSSMCQWDVLLIKMNLSCTIHKLANHTIVLSVSTQYHPYIWVIKKIWGITMGVFCKKYNASSKSSEMGCENILWYVIDAIYKSGTMSLRSFCDDIILWWYHFLWYMVWIW